MSFLLDTNIVSEARRRKPNPGFARWWAGVSSSKLYLSVLTVGEIERGIHKLRHRGESDREQADALAGWLAALTQQFSNRIFAVTAEVAAEWGRQCSPHRIPSIDGLIAATASAHDLTLVTRNVSDMADTGARLHNPFA
ncbi:type II toxin-antitoxin system VapC family toxin [Amycolatopsis sp. H20-H5]|uniref:type II toxin-antitoxin system VapC family toxin n=1 Tax=Amycolatopsis sp. H20-H5 TaxID=3046309 RepID=UPI002DBB86EA|nr:type II toxin-antitoxin system VapC family toxin [Amycolatopsis sp. H20-H5]MEC3977978.1 type II toxin-antitoxin system VapC family toxin [Amycolatopsis sp. H20-H5]